MEKMNIQPNSGLEEFSIMELEDRLEMAERCNNNCSCPAPPSPQQPTIEPGF